MAGIYHNYTFESSGTLFLGYQCSKCGKKRIVTQTVTGNGYASDKGALTKRSVEKRKEKASEAAKVDLNNEMISMKSRIRNRDYRKLTINSPCEQCGNQELWFNIQKDAPATTWKISLVMLLVILAIILLFVLVFHGHKTFWLIALGIAALGFIICSIIDEIYCRKIEKEIELLPLESLPTVIEDEETAKLFGE